MHVETNAEPTEGTRRTRTLSSIIASDFSRISESLWSRMSGVHAHGWGIGEVRSVDGSEGDGCARLGCRDEQKCCPGFWNDRGVPPIWPLSWIFDPHNKHLNDNKYARMFGNFGFKFFDKERKAFMGTALAVTIISMLVTVYGLLSLSSSTKLLHSSAWGIASFRFDTDDGKVGQTTYIGLQKFVIITCYDAQNSFFLNWKDCSYHTLWWNEVKCESGDEDFHGFPCGPIAECADTSSNTQFGATMTCLTLIFAMIGCLTRMRKVADTNFQKMIGCFPDTLGIITQAQALADFAEGCYNNMPKDSTTGDYIHYRVGPGYWAFVVCWLAAVIRASVHYCTPVPGGGVGCKFVDMKLAAVVVSAAKQSFNQTPANMDCYIEHGNMKQYVEDGIDVPIIETRSSLSKMKHKLGLSKNKRADSEVEITSEVSNDNLTVVNVSKI